MATRNDWFRNTDWNPEIEAVFFQRLRRVRGKAQYLRLQASQLSKSHPHVSLRLLAEYFSLGDHFDLAQAHVEKAQALVALDDLDTALSCYEDALERERQFPNVKTQAYLDFAFLVTNKRMPHLYTRALEVLDSHLDRPHFPMERYLARGTRALILHELGYSDAARSNAKLALAAAAETQSGFRYHQNIGVVADIGDEFGTRVAALANRS